MSSSPLEAKQLDQALPIGTSRDVVIRVVINILKAAAARRPCTALLTKCWSLHCQYSSSSLRPSDFPRTGTHTPHRCASHLLVSCVFTGGHDVEEPTNMKFRRVRLSNAKVKQVE